MAQWEPNIHTKHSRLGLFTRCCITKTLTKALAQIGLFVNKDFGRDHISKRHKHLQKILVPKLLWQVVDEQIGTFWSYSILEVNQKAKLDSYLDYQSINNDFSV